MIEIAGLDDTQLRCIYFRPRDEHGNLVRAEQEQSPTKHVGFEGMFKDVWTKRTSKEEAEERWQLYLERTPSLVEHLEKMGRKRKRKKNGPHRRRHQDSPKD